VPRWLSVFATVLALAACSQEGPQVPPADYREVALEFTKRLAAREYAKAYAMTTSTYRHNTSLDHLRTQFETIVPTDWGTMGPIEVGQTMASWPGKEASDLGWAYVSIGGNVYSEAITVVVASEGGQPRIRQVEFGRP
jgi:hypothetical protein